MTSSRDSHGLLAVVRRIDWRDPTMWAATLVATLPLMMAAHIAINHLLDPVLGTGTTFFYPEVLLGAVLVALTWNTRARSRDVLWSVLVALAWAIGVWYVVCAILQRAPIVHWPRRIGLEWALGPLLGVAFAKQGQMGGWRRVQEAYFWSLWAGSFIALGLYLVSFGVPSSFEELIFMNRTYLMQFGLAAGVYFGELTFGGVNDIAAFFGIGLVLYLAATLDEGEPYRLRWLLVPAVLAVEFLCYSRGALLALGLGCFVLLVAKHRAGTPWVRRGTVLATALLAFGVLLFSPHGAVSYWRGQLTLQEDTTAAFRVRVWSHALNAEEALAEVERDALPEAIQQMREKTSQTLGAVSGFRDSRLAPSPRANGSNDTRPPEDHARRVAQREAESLARRAQVQERVGGLARRLVLGYGTGNFGLLAGTTPDMSVHNMFLEAFAAGGTLGVLLYAVFWGAAVVRAARWALTQGTVASAGPLAVTLFMLVQGQTGHVRLENLGAFILGTVFWWVAARVGQPATQEPAV